MLASLYALVCYPVSAILWCWHRALGGAAHVPLGQQVGRLRIRRRELAPGLLGPPAPLAEVAERAMNLPEERALTAFRRSAFRPIAAVSRPMAIPTILRSHRTAAL